MRPVSQLSWRSGRQLLRSSTRAVGGGIGGAMSGTCLLPPPNVGRTTREAEAIQRAASGTALSRHRRRKRSCGDTRTGTIARAMVRARARAHAQARARARAHTSARAHTRANFRDRFLASLKAQAQRPGHTHTRNGACNGACSYTARSHAYAQSRVQATARARAHAHARTHVGARCRSSVGALVLNKSDGG
jgi:hypothetical protein